ncbi:hypothetical protein LTR91_021583 [Friedmanniomyces endolithicus]|uniref:Uncharacterized protein n=2 Tax=Dothideomycetidae TaxID=451867 RepID=A0A4U0UHW0_9PEZI|nr:hypothetical protein LTS09_000457 [Friedmanniomyces endolithicus]KAK5143254.1 hypothetical protein LTR32_004584 [Rachicladosporium monterosium]KAK0355900.1 hypothetical protein LTR94_006801 [Friedmanniomyces endolithicus]KAK0792486.1 hypothetical protein LTR59_008487 [Friedmanniomyces endolithicus]KAK0803946.1 hypothetical protein LTR38_006004 [Friedmanniomyces endolithicus]
MQRPRKPDPNKPLTNGYHKKDAPDVNAGGGGSGGGNGGGAIGPASRESSSPDYWFCCDPHCQTHSTFSSAGICPQCGHARCSRYAARIFLYEQQ